MQVQGALGEGAGGLPRPAGAQQYGAAGGDSCLLLPAGAQQFDGASAGGVGGARASAQLCGADTGGTGLLVPAGAQEQPWFEDEDDHW